MRTHHFALLGFLAFASGLAGCSGAPASSPLPENGSAPAGRTNAHDASSPIRHVVIMIQENRSFG